jgi:hypothetical protein
MSDLSPNETWQVEVNGQVYDAQFDELAAWIADGALHPEDKVRRANLRWIEAGKVPKLTVHFDAKVHGLPPPEIIVRTVDGVNRAEVVEGPSPGSGPKLVSQVDPVSVGDTYTGVPLEINSERHLANRTSERCRNHELRAARYICLSCSVRLCRECVKAFGSSVMICSECGGMCKVISEFVTEIEREEFRSRSLRQGFGFSDFFEALAYPFRFKTSLFFGGLLFIFFSLGKLATSFGGIYMIVGSLFSYMLANMLIFGILSNTIDSFAHGKIGGDFMPAFEDFSVWDDVVHPFLLTIGAYLTAFGPFLIVFAIGSYLVFSSVASQMDTVKANLETTPGTPYYNVRDTVDQSQEVKGVLSETERINEQRLAAQEQVANSQAPVAAEKNGDDGERIDQFIAENKRKELESVVGKSAETRDRETSAFIAALLKLAAPIMVIGVITFLWGCFYFPAACMVAGYTQSFRETLNPLVGLDTVNRLGFDYAKVLFMSLILVIGFALVTFVLSIVFSPFDMPGIGNVPARAFESLIWFYLAIVFACLLGFAMFKRSDSLRLAYR